MMLTPVTGEDWQWQHFITVENCGDDFLTAFVEAIQITENYDDLEVRVPFAWRNFEKSGEICGRKTLFRMKKEADQAGFKGTRTGPIELSCKYSFVQSFCVVASSSIIHYKRAGRMVVRLI